MRTTSKFFNLKSPRNSQLKNFFISRWTSDNYSGITVFFAINCHFWQIFSVLFHFMALKKFLPSIIFSCRLSSCSISFTTSCTFNTLKSINIPVIFGANSSAYKLTLGNSISPKVFLWSFSSNFSKSFKFCRI